MAHHDSRLPRRGFLRTTTATAAALGGGAALGRVSRASEALYTVQDRQVSSAIHLEPAREVPIVERVDVVVCGGGPAGVSAAIAAARAGAATRLIDVNGCLGGVWTAGLLSWILDWQNKTGLMQEFANRLQQQDAAKVFADDLAYRPEPMKLLLEELCAEAGVRVSLHTRVVAAARDGERIGLAITESKSGREAIAGKVFIDATGDGDLAAQAGCRFDYGHHETGQAQPMSMMAILAGIDPEDVALFTRGLAEPLGETNPKRRLLEEMRRAGVDPSYHQPTLFYLGRGLFCLMANHEYGVAPMRAADLTAATLHSRREVHQIVDALRQLGGPWKDVDIVATNEHIGVREGRRIHGRYRVTRDDLSEGRLHPDAVCRVTFPVDVHSTDPAREKGIARQGVRMKPYDIPYRALLASDVQGLLLAGRCISGDFVAHSSYRVTGNAVAVGEAAGTAAALAAKAGTLPHEVPWPEIAAALEDLRQTRAKG